MTAVDAAARALAAEWDKLGEATPALARLLSADLSRRAPGFLHALDVLRDAVEEGAAFTVHAWGPETARQAAQEPAERHYGSRPWRVLSTTPTGGEETVLGTPWVVGTAPA